MNRIDKLGKIAVIALCAAIARSSFGIPVTDVVTLGAKNDGSADVSAIVNAATAQAELYFPAGKYLVKQPLRIKNPIRGAGFCRTQEPNGPGTWLVSAMAGTNDSQGVVEYAGKAAFTVSDLNVLCANRECGILIPAESRVGNTFASVSRVGIFNVKGTGIRMRAIGSRQHFCDNVTIWGAGGWPEGSIGISACGTGVTDTRLSNVEIMGTQIALEAGGHVYGSNLHLWTGSMDGRDNGKWWVGTRSILLHRGTIFHASQVYPDTSYRAIEMRGSAITCSLSNVMYWDDLTPQGSPRHDGAFLESSDPDNRLSIRGGLVEVAGNDASEGWMRQVYPGAGAHVEDVTIKCDYAIRPENFDRLCFNTVLPEYAVRLPNGDMRKVADIFTLSPHGECSGELSTDDGALWRVSVQKDRQGKTTWGAEPLNGLCEGRKVQFKEIPGMVSVYLASDCPGPFEAKFRTLRMGARFRPVDYGCLRSHSGASRCR